MVEVDWKIVLVQLITFLVAFPLIWGSMIKGLRNTLKARDEHIQGTLDKIEKDKADIEAMKADYEKKIADSHAQAKAAYEKALAEGERVKNEITESAKAEGARMLETAKRELEVEKQKAIEEVKDIIVDISMMAAEKIVKANVSKKSQQSVIEEAIAKLGKKRG